MLTGIQGEASPFSRAAEAGFSAPYLYLLEEEKDVGPPRITIHTRRKLNQVNRAIAEGYGQGRGEDFKPWLRIRRNFSSPVSYQVFAPVGLHRRNHHFLSRLEFYTALQVCYLGPEELRECLPMWPVNHVHPDSFLSSTASLVQCQWVPGLLDIAREAGIEHGCYVGTTTPYVASTDLAFRFGERNRRAPWPLLFVGCKPREILDASARARERMALEALYAGVVGARHVVEDGTGIHLTLVKNLEWLRPLPTEVEQWRGSAALEEFSARFDEAASHAPISDAVDLAARRMQLAHPQASAFFRLACWLRLVDIDLSRPVLMSKPIRRGAAAVVEKLRTRYLGVAA